MIHEVETINWDEWEKRFGHHIRVDDFEHPWLKVEEMQPYIWTEVTDDNGDVVIVSGWHFVNRLAYYVTSFPVLGEDIYIEVVD